MVRLRSWTSISQWNFKVGISSVCFIFLYTVSLEAIIEVMVYKILETP